MNMNNSFKSTLHGESTLLPIGNKDLYDYDENEDKGGSYNNNRVSFIGDNKENKNNMQYG